MNWLRPEDRWRLLAAVPAWLFDAAGRVPALAAAAAAVHDAQGRIGRAVAALGAAERQSGYGARLGEELAALSAGGLPLPPPPVDRRRAAEGRRGVVMALYGSAPWLNNGYAVRTRCLLDELARRKVPCTAVTRPNFPQDLRAFRTVPQVAEEEADGHRYLRLASPVRMWGDPLSSYVEDFADRLAAVARDSGAAVIHAASNHVCGLAACLAAERAGCRSVYEIRGLWHRSTAVARPGWERSEKYALHEALERQAALRADHVIVLSQALAEHVRAWGVAAERITVAPNGIDRTVFRPRCRDEALRTALGAGPRSFLVGYVGTFAPYEGLDTLVEAVARMRRRGVDAVLALVGGGAEEARLRRLARRRAVPASFPGRIPFSAVPDHYAAFDACAFPRRPGIAELVPPLKLAEAMACGVAPVVSDLPPLREMVADGVTGVVASGVDALTDALCRLSGDVDARTAIAAAAAAWAAENRDWSVSGALLLQAYGLAGKVPA